jgi:hypothetical protein
LIREVSTKFLIVIAKPGTYLITHHITPRQQLNQPLPFHLPMALNWTMLNTDRTPVPLPGELMIMTVDSGADVSLTIPDVPPTGSSTSGGSGGGRNMNGIGKLFLTDQRVRSDNLVFLLKDSPGAG